jgi:hypothetical protein
VSDPVQSPLRLVLTLKSGVNAAQLKLPLAEAASTNILHFAWLIPLAENKVLLSTVYDGDFDLYLDTFIDANPAGFDAALAVLEDAPSAPITDPVNRAAFHDYVRKNNVPLLGGLFSAYPDMTVVKILRCPKS